MSAENFAFIIQIIERYLLCFTVLKPSQRYAKINGSAVQRFSSVPPDMGFILLDVRCQTKESSGHFHDINVSMYHTITVTKW